MGHATGFLSSSPFPCPLTRIILKHFWFRSHQVGALGDLPAPGSTASGTELDMPAGGTPTPLVAGGPPALAPAPPPAAPTASVLPSSLPLKCVSAIGSWTSCGPENVPTEYQGTQYPSWYRCNSWVLWSSVRGVLAPDPHHVSVPIDLNISDKSVPIMGAGV